MRASERLVAWRKVAGLSQREAAARAGVAQPTFSDLEHGRARRVSVDTALAIERLTAGLIRVAEWESHGVSDADSSAEHPAVDPDATGTDDA